MTHGTHSGYTSGCRCAECREAHRIENSVYYHDHAPQNLPAPPVATAAVQSVRLRASGVVTG